MQQRYLKDKVPSMKAYWLCCSLLGLSTNIRSSNIRSKCIQKREFEREN